MAIHAVFPAAGVGKRFGSDIPKQYVLANGRPLMAWTLQAFENFPSIDQKIIALSEDDEFAPSVLQNFPELKRTIGGIERSDSVLNALNELVKTADPADWVLVHDIARPCVSRKDIEELIKKCSEQNVGGVLARKVTDTVKQLRGSLVSTLNRNELWTVQTPQCFKLGELINALKSCEQRKIAVTDEASAMEACKQSVLLIESSSRNIKLTHSEDLPLIEFYLSKGSAE